MILGWRELVIPGKHVPGKHYPPAAARPPVVFDDQWRYTGNGEGDTERRNGWPKNCGM
jgi:hypothetical protein